MTVVYCGFDFFEIKQNCNGKIPRGIFVCATVLPKRNHLLHDLISCVLLRSLQYGIVVMGFIDAFVFAHLQHRQGLENPGNFGDYMKGRISAL